MPRPDYTFRDKKTRRSRRHSDLLSPPLDVAKVFVTFPELDPNSTGAIREKVEGSDPSICLHFEYEFLSNSADLQVLLIPGEDSKKHAGFYKGRESNYPFAFTNENQLLEKSSGISRYSLFSMDKFSSDDTSNHQDPGSSFASLRQDGVLPNKGEVLLWSQGRVRSMITLEAFITLPKLTLTSTFQVCNTSVVFLSNKCLMVARDLNLFRKIL